MLSNNESTQEPAEEMSQVALDMMALLKQKSKRRQGDDGEQEEEEENVEDDTSKKSEQNVKYGYSSGYKPEMYDESNIDD